MSLSAAAFLCLGLLALDLSARALRIHLFLAGARYPMRYRDVFVLNAFGDAAAVATPLRVAGEPARLLGLLHGGVPLSPALAVLALELVSYQAVVLLAAGVVSAFLVPEWWAAAAPRLASGGRTAAPWILPVLLACVLASRWGRRMRAGGGGREGATLEALRSIRGATGWPLLLSVPLTLLSIAARVAILPVLSATLHEPPPTAEVLVSSFLLIYGQLFLPTPAGLGAVELAFASGAAGDLGPALGSIFWLWRAFSTAAPLVLGLGLALPYYGLAAVQAVLRGRAARPAPAVVAGTGPDPTR